MENFLLQNIHSFHHAEPLLEQETAMHFSRPVIYPSDRIPPELTGLEHVAPNRKHFHQENSLESNGGLSAFLLNCLLRARKMNS